MQTMRAAVLEAQNGPFVIKDVPMPLPAAGQVRVRLRYASLNHRDVWIRQGQYAGLAYPCIVGSDGVGVLDALGEDTTSQLAVGDAVLIDPSLYWGDNPAHQGKQFRILGLPDAGTLAEYVCVPVENIYALPTHLGQRQAAALPLAGVTAYRALFTRANLQAGERLLVTGGGGGVALFAIQFGLAAGAQAYATTGAADKADRLKKLGVVDVENYKQADWDKRLRAGGFFDVIVDSAGGPDFGKLIDLLAPGGRIVFMGGTAGAWPAIKPQKLFYKQASLLGTTMGSTEDFAQMLAFVEKHSIVPIEDSLYRLADMEQAAQRMAGGGQFGKIVVQIG